MPHIERFYGINVANQFRELDITEEEGAAIARLTTGRDDVYWAVAHRNHDEPIVKCPECGAPGYDWRFITYAQALRNEIRHDED